jgi:hypothetical protein
VDVEQARKNAAVAALMAFGLADMGERPAPRQTREEIDRVLRKTGLDKQMQTYGLWEAWEKGQRGRR